MPSLQPRAATSTTSMATPQRVDAGGEAWDIDLHIAHTQDPDARRCRRAARGGGLSA